MLIHNSGFYNKKAIEHIGSSNAKKLNISEGKKVELPDKKIERYIYISKNIIKLLCDRINEKHELEKVHF
ncbi:hypothetical protein IZY60_13265 [Lutibacter sp. B2]|nr:hypothetical protein [Lutibacter sp. B2]